MSSDKNPFQLSLTRRAVLKAGVAGVAAGAAPMIIPSSAWGYANEPTGSTVTLGFNVPQSGAYACLLYTSPSPRDATLSRMPSSA